MAGLQNCAYRNCIRGRPRILVLPCSVLIAISGPLHVLSDQNVGPQWTENLWAESAPMECLSHFSVGVPCGGGNHALLEKNVFNKNTVLNIMN